MKASTKPFIKPRCKNVIYRIKLLKNTPFSAKKFRIFVKITHAFRRANSFFSTFKIYKTIPYQKSPSLTADTADVKTRPALQINIRDLDKTYAVKVQKKNRHTSTISIKTFSIKKTDSCGYIHHAFYFARQNPCGIVRYI